MNAVVTDEVVCAGGDPQFGRHVDDLAAESAEPDQRRETPALGWSTGKTPVRVELEAPSEAVWTWGPGDAPDRITGTALAFGLAVTQRRHRDGTALAITGAAAEGWTSIAPAFAGTAGTGRTPGQFA